MGRDDTPTILFVAPSAYPLGGVATWLDYVMLGLAEHGWTVHLCLTSGRFHDAGAYLQTHHFDHVSLAQNLTGSREGRLQALTEQIRISNPQIVACVHLVDVYAAVDRIRIGQNSKIRLVTTLHGIQPDCIKDIATYGNVIDAVVCTNRLTRKLVESEGKLDVWRTLYAPYGVQISDSAKRFPAADRSELRIAFVGRFDQFQKRVHDLPAIVQHLTRKQIQFRLLLAGAGPDEVQLKEQLAPWISAGNVEFLGALSAEDLSSRVYQVVDALLITSYWETGPLVAWEAMAQGVPVVSSEFIGSGLEGAFKHDETCLLFPIGDALRAAECLIRLMDEDVHDRISAAGRDLVLSRYSLEESVTQWDSCFRQVLGREARPHSRVGLKHAADGRLDNLLGPRLGERVRRVLGREFRHREPGGEWPHTESVRSPSDENFWVLAQQLDQE